MINDKSIFYLFIFSQVTLRFVVVVFLHSFCLLNSPYCNKAIKL